MRAHVDGRGARRSRCFITREERDELRRLYEAAAQGEWGFREANPPSPGNISVVAWGRRGSYVHVADRPPECSAEEWNANNDLIVAARNALPRLLDTIAALEARNERMLRLLAGFAYRDWSEYAYAASWYDTNRKPDSWFDSLQKSFEVFLRGEHDWGGLWDSEIHDERIVDAMRRALEATE